MSGKFKKLEEDLITEFKNNPIYHIQALCFINRSATNNLSDNDISTLMRSLSAILASEDEVMSHLKDCLTLMADTEDKFNLYLEYFKDVPSNLPIPVVDEFYKLGPQAKPDEMDKIMKYELVFLMENKIPFEKIEEFAIKGLGMEATEYRNKTLGKEPSEKLREVFYLWQQQAPYHEYCNKRDQLPPFTNRGLQGVLDKCGLSDVMGQPKQ